MRGIPAPAPLQAAATSAKGGVNVGKEGYAAAAFLCRALACLLVGKDSKYPPEEAERQASWLRSSSSNVGAGERVTSGALMTL